jgi:hypothetical protein
MWAINKKRKEYSMKNIFKLIGIIALAAVIGFSMAACGGSGDDEDGEEIYIGSAGNVTYKLIITNTRYVLTAGGKTSTGTIERSPNGFTLIPSRQGAVPFTATVSSGGNLTSLPDNTTWDDGTPFTAPGTLTGGGGNPPVNPGGAMKWTKVENCPFDTGINAIAYGNGKFVAVGNKAKIAYSSDNGVTWTAAEDSKFINSDIKAIAYGNGLFVAVGQGGRIATSPDGVTWTRVTDSTLNNNINAIAYGNNKFVAGDSTGRMATSTDGVTWTRGNTAGTDINAITYGNGKFVVCFSYNMGYSSDGINWTPVENSPFSYATSGSGSTIRAIAYGNGKFVAGGGFRGRMAYSSDGVTWTLVQNSTFGDNSGDGIRAIVYGNNKFVAGGQGDNGKMAISTDGINWTANDVSSIFEYITAIAYNDGRYVAAGWGIMAYSSDGTGGGGNNSQTTTYTGTAGSTAYTLKVTGNTSTAQSGDAYELTAGSMKSTGTVSSVSGGVLTLKPSNATTTFTATVSGSSLTALNGTITWTNNTTATGPGTFTGGTTPGTGGGGLVGIWYLTQELADTATTPAWEFRSDGKLFAAGVDSNMTYTATSNTINLYYSGTFITAYNYTISGTVLTCINSENPGGGGLMEGTYYKPRR